MRKTIEAEMLQKGIREQLYRVPSQCRDKSETRTKYIRAVNKIETERMSGMLRRKKSGVWSREY